MKSQEQKTEFIKLRAEGKSYATVSKTLDISKGTCTAWDKEFKEQIAQLKQEQLDELYSSYYMAKEARIKKLGDTLAEINTALEKINFTAVPPEKLLDFKLKYMDALKEEYIGTTPAHTFGDNVDAKEIVIALGDLLNRVRSGEVSTEQANKEGAVLSSLLKAYDVVELKTKLEALEAVIGGRTNGK